MGSKPKETAEIQERPRAPKGRVCPSKERVIETGSLPSTFSLVAINRAGVCLKGFLDGGIPSCYTNSVAFAPGIQSQPLSNASPDSLLTFTRMLPSDGVAERLDAYIRCFPEAGVTLSPGA